jgi:MBG domain (YGX type)
VALDGSGNASCITFLAAGTHTIEATYNPAGSFLTSNNSATIIVSQAPLIVTGNNASRAFGAVNHTFSATIAGFVNGDTSGVVSGAPSLTTPATPDSEPDYYPIIVGLGTLTAANYTFFFVNGILTVTPGAPQPATISVFSGSEQSGVQGSALSTP